MLRGVAGFIEWPFPTVRSYSVRSVGSQQEDSQQIPSFAKRRKVRVYHCSTCDHSHIESAEREPTKSLRNVHPRSTHHRSLHAAILPSHHSDPKLAMRAITYRRNDSAGHQDSTTKCRRWPSCFGTPRSGGLHQISDTPGGRGLRRYSKYPTVR